MTHFLESERLYLRAVEESDLTDDYYAWMNDQDVNRYMETWHFPHTRENIRNYIKVHTDNRNEPFFAIMKKDKGMLPIHVGNIKLGPINFIHRHADISLFIGNKGLWGQGYGTEAIKLITEYAFKKLGLHKVKSGIYRENLGSFKAFEKAGFNLEAILPSHVFLEGRWIDLLLVGKLNV